MTKEELKIIIKSPENARALKAIEIVSNPPSKAGGIEDLRKLLPLPSFHYKMDPAHPRSRFLTESILAACYSLHELGVQKQTVEKNHITTQIGPVDQTPETSGEAMIKHKQECWDFLIDNGVTEGGSNGWRGELFKHVVDYALRNYDEPWHMPFAKKVVETMPNFQIYIANSYDWLRSVNAFENAKALGMDPLNPKVFMTTITYLNCATSSKKEENGRYDVIQAILSEYDLAGVALDPRIGANIAFNKKEECLLLENRGMLRIILYKAIGWDKIGVEDGKSSQQLFEESLSATREWKRANDRETGVTDADRDAFHANNDKTREISNRIRGAVNKMTDEYNQRYESKAA